MSAHRGASELSAIFAFAALSSACGAQSEPANVTVVEDLGGASALPYYRALNLQPRSSASGTSPTSPPPPSPHDIHYSESDFLPVHSLRLSPGTVVPRVIQAPALTPMFLIGDDEQSRTWMQQHIATLRSLRAVGVVVQVDSYNALLALRKLAPGLTLVPMSGDDLAQRLKIAHYPALVTATGIEQ